MTVPSSDGRAGSGDRPRLLLCRPQGGLNDVLCQIGISCEYADRFDRVVVVDTDHPDTRSIRDSFDRYFVSREPRLELNVERIRGVVDHLDVSPGFLKGRVNSYQTRYDPAIGNFVDSDSGIALTFDMSRDHQESLLVHHACGGGNASLGALARMRLHEDLVDELLARLRRIGPRYAAIHIRNTDIRSRYQPALEGLARQCSGAVFVATDGRDSIADCEHAFGKNRLFSFATFPDKPVKRLHQINRREHAYQRNVDAILDLLMLALATEFHCFELEPNEAGLRYSGFAVLAQNLRDARPVLRALIARQDELLARLL